MMPTTVLSNGKWYAVDWESIAYVARFITGGKSTMAQMTPASRSVFGPITILPDISAFPGEIFEGIVRAMRGHFAVDNNWFKEEEKVDQNKNQLEQLSAK